MQKKILRFVDIDETVFHTTAKIKIRSAADDSLVASLSNKKWNVYSREKLYAKAEYADFSEFADANKFFNESEPIEVMVKKLREWSYQMKTNPEHKDDLVIFVTARGNFDDREKFLDTFRRQLIYIDDKDHFYVSRTGNLTDDARVNGLPLSTSQRKKIEFLHYLMAEMPDVAELYEDDISNIKDFLELKKEMPNIKYKAFLVEDGQITEMSQMLLV